MQDGRWPLSPLTVAVAAVVVVATVLGFVFAEHSVESQNQALLKGDATQASEYVSSIVSSFGTTLDALASGVTLSHGSPTAFESQARPLAGAPVTIVLARKVGKAYEVSAAVGQGFSPGQTLDPTTGAVLERANANLTPGPATYNGKTARLMFAIGPPLVPRGFALFEHLTIDPFLAVTAVEAAPFHALHAAVYASHDPLENRLVLANTRALPIAGSTVEVPVSVGSARWWIVAAARNPLTGGFPNDAPFIILAVGLVLALALATTVEGLVRRHRYARDLVAQRTAELDASHAALVRSERLSAVGEMASVIGHELRNPLAAVVNAHFMVRHTLGDRIPSDVDRQLLMAERQTARAATLADDLTAFVRDREIVLAPVEVRSVVHDVLEATPPPPGISVEVDVPSIVLPADNDQFTQVVANLVANAVQAMPDGGVLSIDAESVGDEVVLHVADTGQGVDPGTIDRLFDPFFTTKSTGTGLGLAIVARIVQSHGGRVTIENRPAGGAVVTLVFPGAMSHEPARV
jgi:signal transduction histidine kinase